MSFDREAFDHRAMMAGSHNRAAVIAELDGLDLEPELLREILAYQWPVVDGSRAHYDAILRIFERAGFTTDQEGFTPDDLPTDDEGDVEIFRGNVGEDPALGLSWTLDRDVAERFAAAPFQIRARILGYGAHREDGEEPIASVWGGWVWPENVLGYFDGRGEKEIIVGAAGLAYQPQLVAQAVSADG